MTPTGGDDRDYDDYYEPHARSHPERPLVLTGHPASGVDLIGRAVSGRTGWAFNDVERATEAAAGMSRGQLLLERGLPALRELELAALATALHRSPVGIVVMESGLLEEASARELLRERAISVHVQRPLEILFARITERCRRAPGSLPEFVLGAPRRHEELRAYLAARERSLGELDWILDAGDRHPARVAGELLGMLPQIVPVASAGPRGD